MELAKIKLEHEFLEESQTLEEKCDSADEILEYRNLCMKSETLVEEILVKEEPPTHFIKSFTESDCSAQLHLESSNTTTKAEETTFKCKFCPVTLLTKRLLDNHEVIHLNGKPWEGKFDLCEKVYPNKYISKIDKRSYAREKPFQCFICGHKFSRDSHLVNHIRTHTGGKPFECFTCGHKCAMKFNLVKHIKTHTGEKPFKCVTCGGKFAKKEVLVNHIRTHTGEKPFQCFTCGHKFSKKFHLVNHIRRHTGEKPFKCVTCHRKFAVKGDLIKHIRTHTGVKPFKCATCGYKFSVRGNLVRHIRRNHSKVSPKPKC